MDAGADRRTAKDAVDQAAQVVFVVPLAHPVGSAAGLVDRAAPADHRRK